MMYRLCKSIPNGLDGDWDEEQMDIALDKLFQDRSDTWADDDMMGQFCGLKEEAINCEIEWTKQQKRHSLV